MLTSLLQFFKRLLNGRIAVHTSVSAKVPSLDWTLVKYDLDIGWYAQTPEGKMSLTFPPEAGSKLSETSLYPGAARVIPCPACGSYFGSYAK